MTQPGSTGGTPPAVSVVMPCFNAEDTVEEAVESLLSGSWADFEIIAVDDGSTDGTLSRLHALAAVDDRVKPLGRPHRGLIEALNAGWRASRGELVARMDADDRCHPDRLRKQVEMLRGHPGLAAVGSLVRSFPPEAVRGGFRRYVQWLNSLVEPDEIARDIFVESPLAHPSVVMRRSWLEKMEGYQEFGWAEDYDLWLRMHLAGARFGKVPEVLLYWREHEGRATRTDSRYSVQNFLKAKAHYLMKGPLSGRKAVFIWGTGQMGRRLSSHLLREEAPIVAFIDIDPRKIGGRKRGRPVIGQRDLQEWWSRYEKPALISAVGSHGAREEIRSYLGAHNFVEGEDFWAAA
ncbi:MAG: glycosyltransferase [Anaerolineales bacterium]